MRWAVSVPSQRPVALCLQASSIALLALPAGLFSAAREPHQRALTARKGAQLPCAKSSRTSIEADAETSENWWLRGLMGGTEERDIDSGTQASNLERLSTPAHGIRKCWMMDPGTLTAVPLPAGCRPSSRVSGLATAAGFHRVWNSSYVCLLLLCEITITAGPLHQAPSQRRDGLPVS